MSLLDCQGTFTCIFQRKGLGFELGFGLGLGGQGRLGLGLGVGLVDVGRVRV